MQSRMGIGNLVNNKLGDDDNPEIVRVQGPLSKDKRQGKIAHLLLFQKPFLRTYCNS